MRSSALRAAFITGMLLATFASTAIAQEEHGGGGLLTPQGGLMLWTIAVFLVFFFILTRFAFKPLLAAVEAREASLQAALDKARQDREQAAALLDEQRKQIEAARTEAQRYIADGRATADKMRAEMLEQTRTQQQEMLERARRDIENEKSLAIAALRREAVDLALAGASKVIERNLDDVTNRKLVENFLGSLPTGAKR
jgi:F-type H+-transporting ATPase subunit b